MAQLDWDGDKEVENLMGIYIQHSSQNFINYFQTHPSTACRAHGNNLYGQWRKYIRIM
jgi:hypothetical protein